MLGAICVFMGMSCFASAVPERYKVIMSRLPFGPNTYSTSDMSNSGSELTPEQQKLQEELAKEADLLGKNIKLIAINSYRGVPAAGIVELSSRRTYYLTKGQSILGYTLTDIAESSILLETTNAIANIAMSYAPGQPCEITVHPTSGRLSVLDIYDSKVAATNSVIVKQQVEKEEEAEIVVGGLLLSEDVRKAVTIKEEDGTERISFRELHRLRMEERKRKLEEERKAREEQERAEREAQEALEQEAQKIQEEKALGIAEIERIIKAEELLIEAEDAAVEQALYFDDEQSFELNIENVLEENTDLTIINDPVEAY